MPKVTVYLPADLHHAARVEGLPLSKLLQQSVEQALRATANTEWIARMRLQEPLMADDVDVHAALDAAREEFGV